MYLDRTGFLDENLNYCMDLDLWIRLSSFGEIAYLKNDNFASFRLWESSKTGKYTIDFLKEIEQTLYFNGAKFYNRSLMKVEYNRIKYRLKKILSLK